MKNYKIETVTNLDEAKVPGYFESIKSVFFTKLLFVTLNSNGEKFTFSVPKENSRSFKEKLKDYNLFEKALIEGNNELFHNFLDDIVSSLIISSWICFEQIIKDLTKKNYSLSENDISVDYKKNSFGFSDEEKRNLDLFYYIRNAIVHYNGAYYTYKSINVNYKGTIFNSKGNEGEKILIKDIEQAFSIHLDLEQYAFKAWHNSKRILSFSSKIKHK
ncbi:MAG TPA: hypothetical protein DHW82_10645 [Spirochaetia bacterium]|nr:MAG: hypothetical protein A2Y41_10915 [Spirochaetes bacterium GWB1_36_13]HCL57451.1 hypothetical protein [Spirochaetia bacterium]